MIHLGNSQIYFTCIWKQDEGMINIYLQNHKTDVGGAIMSLPLLAEIDASAAPAVQHAHSNRFQKGKAALRSS